jgi:membrane complex biogenesis BtpA family protein
MNTLPKDLEMQQISDNPASAIREIFGRDKALIGMIHCPAFPGAPRYRGADMNTIYDACMRDAEALIEGGMHGLMIENHGDVPFSKPENIGYETAAFMSVVTDRIARAVGVPLGVNVLANAPIPAFAIALAGGAKFIRVNQWANAYVANEGFIEGRAAEAMRYRSALRAEHIKVFADSHVKHGSHAIVADRSIAELTRDLAFFDADGVIATGQRTGNAATVEEIEEIAAATHLPLLVGSGVNKANVVEILKRTSGVIVASSLKVDGVWWNPVDVERVRTFRAAAEPALGA